MEFDYIGVRRAETYGLRTGRGFSFHAARLRPRQNVSRGAFYTYRVALVDFSGDGSFAQQGLGFAGFRFDVGNGPQYGWVRIRTIRGGDDNQIAIEDYALG